MPNPILNKLLVSGGNMNPMVNILHQARNMNPKTIVNQIVQSNPNARQVLNDMKNSGMTPKQFAMKCMADRGINPSQILDSQVSNIANNMGIKL